MARDAVVELRRLVETAANQRGHSLVDSGLRLFEGRERVRASTNAAVEPISPFDIGRAHELSLESDVRRRAGAHLTPEGVARGLLTMLPPLSHDATVLDPAVGGAAFLLVAADLLVAAGADPASVPDQLYGIDIDADAVVAAEAALALWAIDHGVEPRPLPTLSVGDGLLVDLPEVDCVVGNPPFLNQLNRASARSAQRRAALQDRWGDLIGAYTDDAWLFVAAGLGALRSGGSLAMVQPMSLLAAQHADAIRHHAASVASLCGLWIAVEQVFDANVRVCGVVYDTAASARSHPVTRRRGPAFDPLPDGRVQPDRPGLGGLAAAALDVPEVRPHRTSGTVGDIATATAGFRDQFYGFVPYVSDHVGPGDPPPTMSPLVTVGMIDAFVSNWGDREFRFAGSRFRAPVVALDALAQGDPTLAAWTGARLRPKLLVATQTRVVEVWVDETGRAVPATPVISVEPREPHDDESDDLLWRLAAAISAPSIAAWLFAAKFGTAMSLNSLKLAARDVLTIPLPGDVEAWSAAADMLREPSCEFEAFGRMIDAAFGVHDRAVVDWWLGRL